MHTSIYLSGLQAWRRETVAPDTEWGQFIEAYEEAKTEPGVSRIVELVTERNLPREAIPTRYLKLPEIWEALLPGMPATAMIRNLGNMTASGLVKPMSDATRVIVSKLDNREWLRRSRLHPITVVNALMVYSGGRRLRGQVSNYYNMRRTPGTDWTPVPAIVDKLNDAFHNTFELVEPTNKRLLLALDVSSSMTFMNIQGMALTPAVGTGVMALVTAAIEPFYQTVAFKHEIAPIDITGRMRLQEAITAVQDSQFGGTDCALPMLYAAENGLEVDTFVVYTDNQTHSGRIHPFQALRQYREKMGINAKLIVVAFVSSGFTIADPQDAGMLDIVGFDTATPGIMSEFTLGRL